MKKRKRRYLKKNLLLNQKANHVSFQISSQLEQPYLLQLVHVAIAQPQLDLVQYVFPIYVYVEVPTFPFLLLQDNVQIPRKVCALVLGCFFATITFHKSQNINFFKSHMLAQNDS